MLGHAWLFTAPWTAAHQAPLSMRFSRQGYWRGLPFPSPGDLPNPGIKPGFPSLQADSLPTELQGKPNSILKSRDNTLPTKVHLVKAMVFPVVMYGCGSWTIKKAEHWRIDAFEWWCWRRLLRIPWTVRRSNKPILKEISPEYSLEGLMLKLRLQYFGHQCEERTHWKVRGIVCMRQSFLHLPWIKWQTMETVIDFIFLGSKITADSDCSWN